MFTKYKSKILPGIAIISLVSYQLVLMGSASASTLAQTMVRFDRLKTSTATTGTVCATATTTATVANVAVTFPSGYTLGTASTFTTGTTNTGWPTGASAWPTIEATAASVSGQVVTWTSANLTVGTLYCFNWTNATAVTTAATASNTNTGTVATETGAAAVIDSGTYTTDTISSDQIVVSATIPQAFSFALSSNSDSIGNLSTGSVTASPTPRTVTINTNAKNGWLVWAKDSNTGLASTSSGHTIASTTPGTVSTLTAGTEGYNLGVQSGQTSGTGTITVATPFASSGTPGKGGGLNTTYAIIASSNGTGASSILTLTNNVAISSTTPAATDYTDTITLTGAGMF